MLLSSKIFVDRTLPYIKDDYAEKSPFLWSPGFDPWNLIMDQKGLFWPWGYVNIEAGYRWRTQAPADEFRYLVEYGLDWRRLYTFVKLNGILSADNGDELSGNQVSGNPSLGIEYDLGTVDITVGGKLLYGFALEGYYRRDLYWRSIAKGYTLGLSLVHHWDWW